MSHENQTALVTGANAGLGFDAAAQLAERGYGHVILACRTVEKAEAARQRLVERVGNEVFDVLAIDVADLDASRKAARTLIEQGRTIDLLVLNAGLIRQTLEHTAQGIEMTLAASLFGHHLLTMELLAAGRLASGAHIVIAGSEGARGEMPGFKVPDYEAIKDAVGGSIEAAMDAVARGEQPKSYGSNATYANAKLWVAWWAAALSRRLPEDMVVVAVSPGSAPDTTFYNVYGLDLIARVKLDPAGGDIDSYYLYDGLGSTTGLTDDAGAVTDSYRYDAFGALRGSTGTSEQAFRFTGEQQDPDVANELYYLRARYYDPLIGRFWTQDPLPFGNLYTYAGNNPVMYVDPYGLFPCGPFGGVCDKVGDAVSGVGNTVGHVLDDVGYVDLNIQACLGVCATVGVQASFGEGVHGYVGGGLGTPQAGVSVTVAPGQHITTGWNCGIQVSAGSGVGFSGTVQVGGALGTGGSGKEGGTPVSEFIEVGGTFGISPFPVSVSETCIYLF